MWLRLRFKVLLTIALLITCFSHAANATTTIPAADNSERLYVIRHDSGRFHHKLYVSITPSLYCYFSGKNHIIWSLCDYGLFVTPEAVWPIARELRKIFANDEQFANAVLKLVHQIPYSKSGPKYPVETLVENSGDCGALSLLAASIMKAGGLDVVLLYYESGHSTHMALGVHLPFNPTHYRLWLMPKFYEYEGKRYWVAETTNFDFEWRVGEEHPALSGYKVKVIPINRCGTSPSQVSASLNSPLRRSSITLDVYRLPFVINGSLCTVKIYGRITPNVKGSDVTVYISRDGYLWDLCAKFPADEYGEYRLPINITLPGTCHLKASWSGLDGYSGADSDMLTFLVGPKSLIQFEGPGFNYTFGRYGLSSLEIRRSIGINSYLALNFSTYESPITCSFIILKGELIIQFENETLPPLGFEPLRLPEDFEMQVRRFLVLAVNRTGESITIHIRGLSLNDLLEANLKSENISRAMIYNATEFFEGNRWYRVTLEVTGNVTTINLRSQYKTPLGLLSMDGEANCMLLLADIKDSIAVFKGLPLRIPAHYDGFYEESPTSEIPWHFLSFATVLLISLIAVLAYAAARILDRP